MRDRPIRRLVMVFLALAGIHAHGAEFIFVNLDGPGEGLNDTAPALPVGGNAGATVGAQRLAALQKAGEIWGSHLLSNVPIRVDVQFDALGFGVLAGAATVSKQMNFANAPRSNTWYPIALANSLADVDLEPGGNDISITANSNGEFYYGLDSATPPGKSNFLDVILHELAHGLGFSSFINGANGNLFLGQNDVFSSFIFDELRQTAWPDMTSSGRVASATSDPYLVWTGPYTTAGLPGKLAAQPGVGGFRLTATFPDTTSRLLPHLPAAFGPSIPNGGLSGELAITDTGSANPTDACGPIINGAQVTGKIAFVRRGSCDFDNKVFTAQQAGATAVVIANNVNTGVIVPGGDGIVDGVPVIISIPTVFISREDGDALLNASPGVQLSFAPVLSQYAGTFGNRLRLYAPFSFSSGSSVSHWSTAASPDLLMEPFISPNLDRKLDLSLTQMKDIGWRVIDIPFPHVTYSAWKSENFADAEPLGEPDDDPDADGVSNLEEYFFGNDPKITDAANLPVFQFSSGMGDFVFTRSKLPADLLHTMEKSTTLDSFQPAVPGVDYEIAETLSPGNDAETVTLRLINPPASLFLRLRIARIP